MAREYKPGVLDWSTLHEPGGEQLFSTKEDQSCWPDKYSLDASLVEQYWRDGYITNIPVLTPEQCDLILHDYKYFIDPNKKHPGMDLLYEYHSNQSGDPDNVLMHCLGHWRLTQLFHDLIFHPKIVVPCSQLLVPGEERAVRFFHDQLFAKPANHGGNVAWHQDYSYWTRTSPCMHITVHLALDHQTEENGCLQYIPGSHRWTRNGQPLPITDLNFKDMDSIKTVLTEEEVAAFHPVPSMLKKGEVSIHHPLMVHGSYPNRSGVPRRAAVVNYFADGVRFTPNGQNDIGHPLWTPQNPDAAVPDTMKAGCMKTGDVMDGQFFPLVYKPPGKTV